MDLRKRKIVTLRNHNKIIIRKFYFQIYSSQLSNRIYHVSKSIRVEALHDCPTSRILYLLSCNLFDIVINSDGKK